MTPAEIIMLVRVGLALYHQIEESKENKEAAQHLAGVVLKLLPIKEEDRQAIASVDPKEVHDLVDVVGDILGFVPDLIGDMLDRDNAEVEYCEWVVDETNRDNISGCGVRLGAMVARKFKYCPFCGKMMGEIIDE